MESSMGHANFYSLPGLLPAAPESIQVPALGSDSWPISVSMFAILPSAATFVQPDIFPCFLQETDTCCPSTHAATSQCCLFLLHKTTNRQNLLPLGRGHSNTSKIKLNHKIILYLEAWGSLYWLWPMGGRVLNSSPASNWIKVKNTKT